MRILGIFFLVAIFLLFGANKLADPNATATFIKSSVSLQFLLKEAGVKVGNAEYVMLAQAVGGLEVFCGVTILLGIARRFFAFILALATIAFTVFMHVDINKPEALLTNQSELIQVMKNVSIVGGLFIVAFTSTARPKKAAAPVVTGKKKQ